MRSSKPAVHVVKVVSKSQLSDKYVEVWLKKPEGLQYEAGQYLSVKVNNGGERRSYSLMSSPMEENLGLLIDTSPGGLGSQFFVNLKEGDEVEILLPMGRFVLCEDEKDVLFVATGSGIAPMRGMIKEMLALSGERKVKLVWGMRHEDDLLWMEEWRELQEKYNNFDFVVVLSQPGEDWNGEKGHVGDALVGDWSGWEAYVCGNGEMVKAVKEQLVNEGMEESSVYFEKFN